MLAIDRLCPESYEYWKSSSGRVTLHHDSVDDMSAEERKLFVTRQRDFEDGKMLFKIDPSSTEYKVLELRPVSAGSWAADTKSKWWKKWVSESCIEELNPVRMYMVAKQNFVIFFTDDGGKTVYESSVITRMGHGWVETQSGSFYRV